MLYCAKVLFTAGAGKVTAVIIANLAHGQKYASVTSKDTPVYKRFRNLPGCSWPMAYFSWL